MHEEDIRTGNKLAKILKKGIVISGAVARTLIGAGAAALLFLLVKKKKHD
jgi:galactokinase/mevalonate kinase-like predicted kinase